MSAFLAIAIRLGDDGCSVIVDAGIRAAVVLVAAAITALEIGRAHV